MFDWIEKYSVGTIVRRMAYETVKGWYIKTVFKLQSDAEHFNRYWHPELQDHSVSPYG